MDLNFDYGLNLFATACKPNARLMDSEIAKLLFYIYVVIITCIILCLFDVALSYFQYNMCIHIVCMVSPYSLCVHIFGIRCQIISPFEYMLFCMYKYRINLIHIWFIYILDLTRKHFPSTLCLCLNCVYKPPHVNLLIYRLFSGSLNYSVKSQSIHFVSSAVISLYLGNIKCPFTFNSWAQPSLIVHVEPNDFIILNSRVVCCVHVRPDLIVVYSLYTPPCLFRIMNLVVNLVRFIRNNTNL
jgi:hypothetical protein